MESVRISDKFNGLLILVHPLRPGWWRLIARASHGLRCSGQRIRGAILGKRLGARGRSSLPASGRLPTISTRTTRPCRPVGRRPMCYTASSVRYVSCIPGFLGEGVRVGSRVRVRQRVLENSSRRRQRWRTVLEWRPAQGRRPKSGREIILPAGRDEGRAVIGIDDGRSHRTYEVLLSVGEGRPVTLELSECASGRRWEHGIQVCGLSRASPEGPYRSRVGENRITRAGVQLVGTLGRDTEPEPRTCDLRPAFP